MSGIFISVTELVGFVRSAVRLLRRICGFGRNGVGQIGADLRPRAVIFGELFVGLVSAKHVQQAAGDRPVATTFARLRTYQVLLGCSLKWLFYQTSGPIFWKKIWASKARHPGAGA